MMRGLLLVGLAGAAVGLVLSLVMDAASSAALLIGVLFLAAILALKHRTMFAVGLLGAAAALALRLLIVF